MFKIKDGRIYHLRGDTAEFDVNITLNGEQLTNYEAVFSVKRKLSDTEYVLQKKIVDGKVRIEHSETQDLDYGNYFYDISVRVDDGSTEKRYASIAPNKYCLLADVTTEWIEDDNA